MSQRKVISWVWAIICEFSPIVVLKIALWSLIYNYWSSRSLIFFKIAVLKNFAIFTEKHFSWSLFSIKACNFIKKRLQHWCFSMNTARFFRKNSLFYETPLVAASATKDSHFVVLNFNLFLHWNVCIHETITYCMPNWGLWKCIETKL